MLMSLSQAERRWYSQEMVNSGASVFQQNCASCHGANAQGTLGWKKTDSNGIYPPPPLNGTAHAWHHDISVLKNTIREGGVPLGGTMPPFKDILSGSEVDAVIAYFQSKWPNKLYMNWRSRVQKSDLPVIGVALP